MPGLLGVVGTHGNEVKSVSSDVIESINMLSLDNITVLEPDGGCLVAASPKNAAVTGWRHYQDEQFSACFCGDLVDFTNVPWKRIINTFREGVYESFPEFAGFHALVVYDARNRLLFLISDLFSFYPLYYRITDGAVQFSSSIATFTRFSDAPAVNKHWLYEWLYYSNAMRDMTPLVGVYRMSPATVLQYEVDSGRISRYRYGRQYRRASKPLEGKKAIERALDVFRERVPLYYRDFDAFAHAITGGFDTRTLLAFLKEDAKGRAITYTYGIPGCNDLIQARVIGDAMRVAHREIYFDDHFLEALPRLIYETVALSGGLENINRSYLIYVYRWLTDNGSTIPVVLSGVGADALLRGHIPTPNGISVDLEQSFFKGKRVINTAFYKKLLTSNYADFENCIHGSIDRFNERYGVFGSLDTYVEYLVYENLPKYFGGEQYLASQFTALRMPFYDPEIIQLIYDLDLSVFRFVRFAQEDLYRENYLQASLIASNPDLARVPLRGIPLKAFSTNSKFLYQWYRWTRRGPDKLMSMMRSRSLPVLDDWRTWYPTVLRDEFDHLFSDDAMVFDILDPGFVRELRESEDIHWQKLIATAEIVFRLCSNGWRLADLDPFG